MTIFKNKKIFAWCLTILLTLPFLTYAEKDSFTGLLPSECTGINAPDECNFNVIASGINYILNWVIGMAGVIATITFAIGGAQMLIHPDNPSKRTEALDMMKKTFFGLVIVLSAWLLVTVAVGALVGKNNSSFVFKFFNK